MDIFGALGKLLGWIPDEKKKKPQQVAPKQQPQQVNRPMVNNSGTINIPNGNAPRQQQPQVPKPALAPSVNTAIINAPKPVALQAPQPKPIAPEPLPQVPIPNGSNQPAPKVQQKQPTINDVGKFLVGGTAKGINTGLGGIALAGTEISGGLGKLLGTNAGNDARIQKQRDDINNALLKPGAGLFGAGGAMEVKDFQKADPLTALRKGAGTGAQVASETLPIGKGIDLATKAAPLAQKVVSGVVQGGLSGGVGSLGAQTVEGRYDPSETIKSTALGALLGGGLPVAGAAAKGTAKGTRDFLDTSSITSQPGYNSQRGSIQVPGGKTPQTEAQVPEFQSEVKSRGFANTAMQNKEVPTHVKEGLVNDNTSYEVRNTQDLVTKAGNLVKTNPNEAERIANTGKDDVAQAIGLELLRKHQAEGNYEAAISRVEDIAKKATENGQATQILAAYGRLTPEGALRFTQRQIDKYNTDRNLVGSEKAAKLTPDKAREIITASNKVQSLPEGMDKQKATAELTQLMGTAAPTPLMQKVTSIWKAGLLTSARTLEGGIIGNASKATLDIPAQAIAAAVDKFLTAPLMNKGVRSNIFTMKGAGQGMAEGVKQAGDYLKTGVDPRDAAAGFDHKGINWEDGNKALNTVGKGSDYVYRALGAIDNPFYYSAKGRANNEEALLEASRRGLEGDAKKNFVDDYVNNLSTSSEDAAVRTAKEAVFQNDTILGSFASKFKAMPQHIKDPVKRDAVQAVVDFTIPFAKIPGAVATALVDYSPAGAVLKTGESIINKARGADVDLRALNASFGKSAVGGIGIVWLGNELYKKGLLTLDEPADEKERQLWQAEGKQKFAIKVGDKWRSLNYVQPIGGLMALGGGYQRAQDSGDDNPIATAAMTGVKSVTQQSFLQGMSDTIDAIQDPKKNAPSMINNKVGSLIPNVLKDTARATDTAERETNNPIDALRNGIPGLRQQSLPQRDLYGEVVATKQSPAGVLLDPFKSTKAKTDPVTNELRRLYDISPKELGVVPTKLDKNESFAGTEVQLSPELLDKFEKTVGPAAYEQLKSTLKDPLYARLSDEDKSKKISAIVSANRNNAKKPFAEGNTLLDKKGEVAQIDTSKLKTKNVSLKPTDGVGDTKLDVNDTAYKVLDEVASLSKDEKKEWSKKPVDGKYSKLLEEANSLKPADVPELPKSNAVAELYASHKKELADNPDWTDLQKGKAQKKFIASAYDSQLSENQKTIASLNSADLKAAIDAKQVTKEDTDAIAALDEIRAKLGLSTYLSKKDRAMLGYGAIAGKASSGGKAKGKGGGKKKGGKGKSAKFTMPKSSFDRVGSTAAIRKLLQSSGNKIKESK